MYLEILSVGLLPVEPTLALPALKHLQVGTMMMVQLWRLSLSWELPSLICLVCEDIAMSHTLDVQDIFDDIGRLSHDFFLLILRRLCLERVTIPFSMINIHFDPPLGDESENIVRIHGLKSVTIHDELPLQGGEDFPNWPSLPSSDFNYFLRLFPDLEHLILSNTLNLWTGTLPFEVPLKRITFEGTVRVSPVLAALKGFTNLQHIRFELAARRSCVDPE